jgi:Tfp pilus assembly protein PilP
MKYFTILFFIFTYLASGYSQTEIKPPTVDDSTSVEDAPSPVPIKKTETPISAFDEEEGMIVKRLTAPFEYDRQAKRDPFRLPEVSGVEIALGAFFGPFLELQEVRLEDVKIKALLLDPLRPKAVISFSQDNNTKQVTRKIFVGDYLGENFGIVQAIREGQIVVVQTFVEGDKKFTTTKTLSIRK